MRLSDIFIVFLYVPWSSGKHAFSGSLGIGAINVSNVLLPLLSASILMRHSHRTPSWYSYRLFLHFSESHLSLEIDMTAR
jgi:hypothetical protein